MSFHRIQWLFPLAVTLHNLEEALTYPRFLAQHPHALPWSIEPTAFCLATAVLTLAAWILTYGSHRQGPQSLPAHLLFGYAAAMLVNVAVPHIPAAVSFRGYTPGLLSAVAVNLPCLSFLLFRALAEHYVVPKKALACSAAITAALALFILLLALTASPRATL